MGILGLDYGAKKIGVAKSDEQNRFALPLEIIKNSGKKETLKQLKEICAREEIDKIVVGIPVSLQAKNKDSLFHLKDLGNKQMREVLAFIDWLRKNIDLPVEIEDERLTSKLANSLGKGLIKKGSADDAVAAMLILQGYLDKTKAIH